MENILSLKDVPFDDTETLMTKYLNDYFKHPFFKNDMQRDVIKKILEREFDVLISLPSGYGRSLCYQLPAIIHAPKVTIVFCSLANRIKDNIDILTSLNITAETLNEDIFLNDQDGLVSVSYSKDISTQLLYVTPNQAFTMWFKELFINLINDQKLAYIVLDEINCERKWIYGQRNMYAILGTLRKMSINIPWIVLTTPIGSDIVDFMTTILNLKTPDSGLCKFSASCFRPNLFHDVILHDKEEYLYWNLLKFVYDCLNNRNKNVHESCGVIFCKNSKIAKGICTILDQRNISVTSYHDGLTKYEQTNRLSAFMNGIVRVITVTGIFGMKINKADIGFVVHWGLPSNILEYYQQSGQAGKNDKPAQCRIYLTRQSLLYYNVQNHSILESKLLTTKTESSLSSFLIFVNARRMKEYCETLFKCRHAHFFDYYGEDIKVCHNKCDVCIILPKEFYGGREAFKETLKKKDLSTILNEFCKEFEETKKNRKVRITDTVNAMKVCNELMEYAKKNWILESSLNERNVHMIQNINDDKHESSHSSSNENIGDRDENYKD